MSQNHRPGERLWIDWAGQTAIAVKLKASFCFAVPSFLHDYGIC
jgi:hypothetical protein